MLPIPAGTDFWWDFALAMGFAGLAMLGVQFLDPRVAPRWMTAGLLSLMALSVRIWLSLSRRRRGTEYDRWRVVHVVLALLVVVLAVVHVIGAGYYVATPWMRVLWGTAFVFWISVVLHVRLVRPWTLQRRPYRVTRVCPERGSAWTIEVTPVDQRPTQFQPGPFAWLSLRSNPFAMKDHPFSFSSSASKADTLSFTIKAVGDFTSSIGTVACGETCWGRRALWVVLE